MLSPATMRRKHRRTRTRVHEAHVDARAGQAGHEGLGADHEVPPDITARS